MRKECLTLLRRFEKKLFKSRRTIDYYLINKDNFYWFENFISKNTQIDKLQVDYSIPRYYSYKSPTIYLYYKKKKYRIVISYNKYKLILLKKNNKEHDFCGWLCRFCIDDYNKFKNKLLLELLKRY